MADTALLYETLDAVVAAAALGKDDHLGPGLPIWQQGSWCALWTDDDLNGCGTAACFAGHRLLLDGYRVVGHDAMRSPQGHEVYAPAIERLARDRLGLTRHQSDQLFDGDNSLVRIKEVVDNLAAGGCGDPTCRCGE